MLLTDNDLIKETNNTIKHIKMQYLEYPNKKTNRAHKSQKLEKFKNWNLKELLIKSNFKKSKLNSENFNILELIIYQSKK